MEKTLQERINRHMTQGDKRRRIWHEIVHERNRQDKLHPVLTPDKFQQFCKLYEEVGESVQMLNTAEEIIHQNSQARMAYDANMGLARQELVQVAAFAVRMLEVWDE